MLEASPSRTIERGMFFFSQKEPSKTTITSSLPT